jgi:N-formylglutamate amidohydrolase
MKDLSGINPYVIYFSPNDIQSDELVAASLHQGHFIEDSILKYFSISESERLREEDPFTDEFTIAGSTRIIANLSRFRVDLNRPRDKAVYFTSEDVWGLTLYKETLPEAEIEKALKYHDAFYKDVHDLLTELVERHGNVFVYDFHSYNHMRAGSTGAISPPEQNPEINLGTGNIDRNYWSGVIERFIQDLREFDFDGRHLDVRENVRFKGGYFSKWISENFPQTVCVIAIEVKKFFMDEWTGIPDMDKVNLLKNAFLYTRSGIIEELKKCTG